MREGLYYRLNCMNALASGLYKASDFTGDEEAIETASNYEATLTKEEYRNGERLSSKLLYGPRKGLRE